MKRLWAVFCAMLVFSSTFAERVFYADELRSKATVPTIDLSANILTDIQAWATIEDVKSAGKDKLVVFRDPKQPSLLYLTSKPGVSGETDLILTIAGLRYRFRLLLGTKTQPLGYFIYERRPVAGTPPTPPGPSAPAKAEPPAAPAPGRAVSPDTQAQPVATAPQPATALPPEGPVEAPLLATTSASERQAEPFYLGFSAGYPPFPISGTFSLANLSYSLVGGANDVLAGLGLWAYLGYVPAQRAFLLEGYLSRPLSSGPIRPYLGLGGGVSTWGKAFLGGLAGVRFDCGPVYPFVELTPRFGFDGSGLSLGLRFGVLFPL